MNKIVKLKGSFSIDHSWIFYTPINRDKLFVIVLGVITEEQQNEKEQQAMMSGKNYGKVSMGVVRTTYLIDERGSIIKANDKVRAANDP